jgi:AraC-like DNA-binding protein
MFSRLQVGGDLFAEKHVVSVGIRILELLARGGAVGALIGIAIVMLRGPFTPARVSGVLFCLGAASHTLTQHPAIVEALGPARLLVGAFSAMGAGLFWVFATELFGDRRRLELAQFAPALLLLVIATAAWLAGDGAARNVLLLAHNIVGGAVMIHVLIVVWTGWRGDLVESRRRLRGPILAAGALYAVAVILVQISEIYWRPASALSPLAAVVLLSLSLAGMGALLRADADLFEPVEPAKQPATAQQAAPALSTEDERLADKLDRLMREDRIYREEGLSISALASKLGMPEYRLRQLINQQLGYRNFSAFLNEWRLADTKHALADPAQREVPISTIALDAGFQSLGPFNRAFKAETGVTPTEFRTTALESRGDARAAAASPIT